MLNKYNICAELMVLANLCYNQGRKKDAVKLFVKAMDEEDSNELIQSLDDINAENDPFAEEAPVEETEEVLSDSEIDEILEDVSADADEEAPVEEPAVDEEAPAEELPEDVEDIVAKVMARKMALANKASLNGSTAARKAAMYSLKRK